VVLIFGLGFTGIRLARRLLARGVDTGAAVRNPERFADLQGSGLRLFELDRVLEDASALPTESKLALLVPPLDEPWNSRLRECIGKTRPKRVVYVSSSSVYGAQAEVNADTVAAPVDEKGTRRLAEERWVSGGSWSHLILRAAAIYGPGRGVHTAVREARLPRGLDSGVVSRIHVDDLAALVDTGLFSEICGVWPVADEDPCMTAEIVRWCLEAAGLQQFQDSQTAGAPTASISGRRVDGREIGRMLRVELRYPSWKAGIPASLEEEETG
jgi:nucleoside-diphosphate-sugar epimerase